MKQDEKTIALTENIKIVINEANDEQVICDICGAKNDKGREMCRVCSNYLDEGGK